MAVIVPITFKPSNYGVKKSKVNGMIYLSCLYEPRPEEVFYTPWREGVYNVNCVTEEFIDRFEHMNDFLSNEFTDTS